MIAVRRLPKNNFFQDTDGGSPSAVHFLKDSPYVIGTFIADAASQTINITGVEGAPGNFSHGVNGYVLRTIGLSNATDFTWNVGSGDWNVSNHWIPFAKPETGEQSSNHTVTFADSIGTATRTVFTDLAVTVNSISFANSMGGNYRIAGGPSINLASTTSLPLMNPRIDVSQGSHTFQAPVNLRGATTANVSSDSTLTFDGALNLGGNTLSKTGTGTMAINNIITTDGGALNCDEGVCSGSGTIGGDLNNNGGRISPGNSPGLLAVNGDASGRVPEPTTLLLLLLGTTSIAVATRRCLSRPRGH